MYLYLCFYPRLPHTCNALEWMKIPCSKPNFFPWIEKGLQKSTCMFPQKLCTRLLIKNSFVSKAAHLSGNHLQSLLPSLSFQPNLPKFNWFVRKTLRRSVCYTKRKIDFEKTNKTSNSCSSDPSSFSVALLKIIFETWLMIWSNCKSSAMDRNGV